MNKLKVLYSLEQKQKNLKIINIPNCDRLIEFKYAKELERSIKNPEGFELICEKYENQLTKYQDNKPEFLVNVHYSIKFFGDEEDLKNLLKVLQKIFPDYFIGLEKVKDGVGGI